MKDYTWQRKWDNVRNVVCQNFSKTAPFWFSRVKEQVENFWLNCYFKTKNENLFTVILINSPGEQVTVRCWNLRNVETRLANCCCSFGDWDALTLEQSDCFNWQRLFRNTYGGFFVYVWDGKTKKLSTFDPNMRNVICNRLHVSLWSGSR